MAVVAELKKDFQKLIEHDALAHGYIFFGHESASEKITFAKELANFFEHREWEVGERILSDAHLIDARLAGGIDLVRAASHFLWQKPAISARRMLIIENADYLTLPAQNAILKIAEEPPAHALLFLIVKDPDVLLPAVVSRFQRIFVAKDSARDTDTAFAREFLKSTNARRKEMLNELLDEVKEDEHDQKLEEFVAGLIAELEKDTIKNHTLIKNILARWTLIRQFNVNKKLQLEAALATLK